MKQLNLIIVTGLSGSGKSVAINALEDAGYFCVDNMPVLLLPKFLELRSGSGSEVQKLALGMDVRESQFIEEHRQVFSRLREEGYHLEILFLEASEEVLLKRYSQTRRQHPLSGEASLLKSIRSENALLKDLRNFADRNIDTSRLTVHELKELILRYASEAFPTGRMNIAVLSFGFKNGMPIEADLVMDVRFIPNPYFIPPLKDLDGKDVRVQQFVKKWPETRQFLEKYFSLIEYLLPLYEKEGKAYLTIAVGCTGGRHRSVTVAEELFARLHRLKRKVTLTHRDIDTG